MGIPDPTEVAKREKERKEIEQRDQPERPMTSSERYAMLARFQSNHRYSLSDMPGRQTVDMLSRPPIPHKMGRN